MPTTNPRIQVTLSPSLDALVGQMARYQRTSKAHVLRELLETAEPGLSRAVALMQAAEQAAGAIKSELARGIDQAQTKAERSLGRTLAAMDQLTGDLVATAERVQERRPARPGAERAAGAGASGPGNPPASNRGVKSSIKGGKLGPSAAPRRPRGGAQ